MSEKLKERVWETILGLAVPAVLFLMIVDWVIRGY